MREERGVEAAGRLRRLSGRAPAPGVRSGDVPIVAAGGWVPEPPEPPEVSQPREPLEPPGPPKRPDGAEHPDPPRVARRAALVVLALAVAVGLGTGARVLLSDAGRPVAPVLAAGTPAGRAPARSGTPATPSSGGSLVLTGPLPGASAGVVVDVVGRVRRPGVVRLPAGSRVADALAAAGGAAPGAAVQRINLARRLVDGEQIAVPGPHDPMAVADLSSGGSGAADGVAGSGPGAPLDLNAATLAQLDGLPGVGPVTAQRILAWRTQHQRFSRVEELGEVDGIGPKMLERLKPLVRV